MKLFRIVPNGADIKVGKNIETSIQFFHMTHENRASAKGDAEAMDLEDGTYTIVQIDPDTSHMCARTETEIKEKIAELSDRVWIDRFMPQHMKCEDDGIQVPLGVCAAAREIESKYPVETLYELSEYEKGKIYGQHSALLWVMGDFRSELTLEEGSFA